MPTQLHFDLPVRVALGEEDFFVSGANADAFALICDDGLWPDGRLAVIGPKGSGKSHLVRLWQDRTGAEVREAARLDPLAPLPAPGARLAVEDLDRLAPEAQEYLFHLHNHLARTGGRLLLTAATAPPAWPIALPDLASRMQAATVVPIRDPDEVLLRAVLTKQFADRQLNPSPSLMDWLVLNLDRSFAAARSIVDRLDQTALEKGRVINRSLAKAILDSDAPADE